MRGDNYTEEARRKMGRQGEARRGAALRDNTRKTIAQAQRWSEIRSALCRGTGETSSRRISRPQRIEIS